MRWIILLGILAFIAIVVARAPASWVMPAPSPAFACTEVEGTIWDGTCIGLTTHGESIGDVSWELHALRLLSGKLNATVMLARPSGNAHGVVEVGLDKNITARDIQADLPLDPVLIPQLPRNFHGNVHADIALMAVKGRVIKTLQGRIEARELELRGAGGGAGSGSTPLGSYSVVFPAATEGDPIGQLHDLGGPLSLEGTLRLTPDPGVDLQSLIAARPGAPADLARDIQYLGSPDAQGRRPFSFEASF